MSIAHNYFRVKLWIFIWLSGVFIANHSSHVVVSAFTMPGNWGQSPLQHQHQHQPYQLPKQLTQVSQFDDLFQKDTLLSNGPRKKEQKWNFNNQIRKIRSQLHMQVSMLSRGIANHPNIQSLQRSAQSMALYARNRVNGARPLPPAISRNNILSKITVANVLIATNILIHLLTMRWPQITTKFIKNNGLIYRGQTYRLLSSLFLHGSLPHLLMNSYSLYNIGPAAERIFGSQRFLFTYILSGVSANTFTYATNQSPYSLGASGATFGMIGAFAMFFFRNKSILGSQATAGLNSIKQTLMLNLFYSFGSKNIDNSAHIAGFVGGAIISYFTGPRLKTIPTRIGYGRKVVDAPIFNIKKLFRLFNKNNKTPSKTATTGSGKGNPPFYPKKNGLDEDDDEDDKNRGGYWG